MVTKKHVFIRFYTQKHTKLTNNNKLIAKIIITNKNILSGQKNLNFRKKKI